jgi:diguanylate cyclase (GGDEF)-like protein
MRVLHVIRSQALILAVVLLGVGAAAAITLLEARVDSARRAEAQVAAIGFDVVSLEDAPISADQSANVSLDQARAVVERDSGSISAGLRTLIAAGAPPPTLLRVQAAVGNAESVIGEIFQIGNGRTNAALLRRELPHIVATVAVLQDKGGAALALLTQAGRIYSARATTAQTETVIGSTATIFLLLCVFVLAYRRATAARAENARLLLSSRDEAVTDPLTGLGNRRAFKRYLEEIPPGANADELMVAMFDLDGFKQYNDTFGHGAGDALLARLAQRLRDTVGSATAYRMGGDEFCLLAKVSITQGEQLIHSAVGALSDAGEGWHVGCSWGVSWMPSEATGPSGALRLADERMYAQKTSRTTVGAQTTAALVQVLVERDFALSTHISRVARLARATAERLGLPEHEITRVGLAAQLHDIGKTAIPESILAKPAPLDAEEWAFIRRHTLIGERIIVAAPSLAHTANLVRSSHERFDGTGYPDGLHGPDIPLGSRIITLCDAYDAMIAPRPYREAVSVPDALSELQACAGSQFDPDVVDAFVKLALEDQAPAIEAAPSPRPTG